MPTDPLRKRLVLMGAAGGLLLGLLSAFFSPAGMRPGMIPLPLKIFVIVGLTALGALFGSLEANARKK